MTITIRLNKVECESEMLKELQKKEKSIRRDWRGRLNPILIQIISDTDKVECCKIYNFMQKKLILHVGHGKTGSSYLQSCLAFNRDKLLNFDIDYPLHKSITKATAGNISSGNGKNFLEIIPDLETASGTILFSNEGLFGSLLKRQKTQFIDLLNSETCILEVVIYTRNLFEYAFSVWGQQVKRNRCVIDLDAFLLQSEIRRTTLFLILEWIELSKKYDFQLTIKNYSNHKTNLVNDFFSSIIRDDDFLLDAPPVEIVNRSLTIPEINFQRVLNNTMLELPPLSDALVDKLPGLKLSSLKCSREAYDFVVGENYKTIERINKYLDRREVIEIESPEKVVSEGDSTDDFSLNSDQVEIISSYILHHFDRVAAAEVNNFRDIAMKISTNQANLEDALWLMEFALKFRPNGPGIKKKVKRWKTQLS